ncbi:MAG: molybdate ABC transporter substrate-binding protein [Halothiobacillaceae bacterium]
MRGLSLFLLVLSGVWSMAAQAEALLIGAAAGYKKPLEALAQHYTASEEHALRRFYGNIGQIITQSERDGRVDVLVGDAAFLDQAPFAIAQRVDLGVGRLVLAWAKGVELKQVKDVQTLGRVALPDARQAIYGRAANAFIRHENLSFVVPPKVLSTVPQISAYLRSGEIDAGFINLTEALALGDSIGGYFELPESSYAPILIQAAVPAKNDADSTEVDAFLRFLQSPPAQKILKGYGL